MIQHEQSDKLHKKATLPLNLKARKYMLRSGKVEDNLLS